MRYFGIIAAAYFAVSVLFGVGVYFLNDGALPWWGAVLVGLLWPAALWVAFKVSGDVNP